MFYFVLRKMYVNRNKHSALYLLKYSVAVLCNFRGLFLLPVSDIHTCIVVMTSKNEPKNT